MDPHQSHPPQSGPPEPLDLATAYAELHHLLLEGPDVVDFLQELARLAAAIVPDTHCAITLRRDDEVSSAAGSDEVALRMDEVQYSQKRGPCLQAIAEARRIDVTDMTTEDRWGEEYRTHALANGIRSVVSLPLDIDGNTLGALNLFSSDLDAFTEEDVAGAQAFAHQAATALTILLRHSSRITLDEQLREALTARAVIDQALGILMHAQKVTASEAFEMLRQESQASNRKVSVLATEIIHQTTGRPPEPPRPLTDRS